MEISARRVRSCCTNLLQLAKNKERDKERASQRIDSTVIPLDAHYIVTRGTSNLHIINNDARDAPTRVPRFENFFLNSKIRDAHVPRTDFESRYRIHANPRIKQ